MSAANMPPLPEVDAAVSATLAGQCEEGFSPVTSPTDTLNNDKSSAPTRTDTFKSRTSSAAGAALRKAISWPVSVGAALVPKTSSSKGEVIVNCLEDHPKGYPRLSYVLSSDESFMMYRQFGQLHSRLLLHKQDELRELEEDLIGLDDEDNEMQQTQIYLQHRAADDMRPAPARGRSRKQLMEVIEQKLLEYGKLLAQANQLQGMNKPTDRDHKSVCNYIDTHQPLVEGDRDFIYHKEDLITIRTGREHAWLDAAVESILRWYPCTPVKYLFCSEETKKKTSDPRIHYFSRSRISFVVTLFITILILILLVVPIWVLFYLTVQAKTPITESVANSVAVVLVCTLIFSAMLCLFTKARRHEILAAAAGYCAVLVVFVGNLGNINSGPS